MATLLYIERQAWLVSVALHTVIALGFVGLARELTIDATEPFHLELVLVAQTAPTLLEPIESAPKHIESSNKRTKVSEDIVQRPARAQEPRPVIESKVAETELQQMQSLKNPENTESLLNTEPAASVVEQEGRLSSVPSIITQSSMVPLSQVTQDEVEMRMESDHKLPNIESPRPPETHDEDDKEILATTNRDPDSEIHPSSVPAQSAGLADAAEHQAPIARADSQPTSTKPTAPDYSWLKRLLWERIDRVKRYSDDAFENEWEGRVVILLTVKEDGQIEDVRVAESSGNPSLDREATTLITQVSPVPLDRPLGAHRVKIRVPISFGLKRMHQ